MVQKKFSSAWKSSSQRRKQRKYRHNAPLHIRQKFVSATLSEELRKKYGRRSVQLRKGDTVRIMRGEHRGKTGKVERVFLKKTRIYIEGIMRPKKAGVPAQLHFHPSKLMITEAVTDDKQRKLKITKETKA